MAVFDVAFDWMMDNEDANREYASVPDVGGQAISGINSHSFPTDFAAIVALPQASRGPSVRRFYQIHFWNTWFDQLQSNDLAKRVFDAGVNMGSGTAVKLLQVAVNALRTPPVTEDGGWGPNTLSEANSCDSDAILRAFIDARVSHYENIAQAKPEEAKYLPNWLGRAKK